MSVSPIIAVYAMLIATPLQFIFEFMCVALARMKGKNILALINYYSCKQREHLGRITFSVVLDIYDLHFHLYGCLISVLHKHSCI